MKSRGSPGRGPIAHFRSLIFWIVLHLALELSEYLPFVQLSYLHAPYGSLLQTPSLNQVDGATYGIVDCHIAKHLPPGSSMRTQFPIDLCLLG